MIALIGMGRDCVSLCLDAVIAGIISKAHAIIASVRVRQVKHVDMHITVLCTYHALSVYHVFVRSSP